MKNSLADLNSVTDKILSYQKKQKPKTSKRAAASEVNRLAVIKNKSGDKAKAAD